jgi:hypothetical protein
VGTESRLRQKIRAAIRAEHPSALIVGQPANGMTGRGRPDLYVVVVGRFVGLEVKTSTGRATQIQLDRIRLVRRAGGYAGLVRSTRAALWLVDLAHRGAHMAEQEAFDIDKLLASFRPDETPDKEVRQDAWPATEDPEEDLNRPIAGFVPSEEHIAAAAQANGTAAGDGVSVGDVPSGMEILARAMDDLTAEIRNLGREVAAMRAAREPQAAPEESSGPSEDLVSTLLAGPTDPSETPTPPKPRQRRKSS